MKKVKLPDAYYQFVMDYVPYVYVVPESGPAPQWGRAAFAAGFAVDFLFEAYFDPQFEGRSGEIEAKIVELADWMLTQQCTDSQKHAYGGFERAVALLDEWLGQMDVECLYGLTALKMLCESDPANKDTYETMMADAVDFCCEGLAGLYLYYDPPLGADGR